MPEEDHKLLKWVNEYVKDGAPTDEAMKRRFVHLSDTQRTLELQNFGTWFYDDNATIRQKASLLKLGRELNVIHQKLRKVGR